MTSDLGPRLDGFEGHLVWIKSENPLFREHVFLFCQFLLIYIRLYALNFYSKSFSCSNCSITDDSASA